MKKYKNKEWLHSKYINENLTRQKVAELAGVSSNTIRRYLRIHGSVEACVDIVLAEINEIEAIA